MRERVRSRRSRRALLVGAGGAAVVALPALAACAAPGGAGAGAGAEPARAARYDGKRFQHWGSYSAAGVNAWKTFYDRFVQAQAPGLQVEVQGIPNAEYLPKLTAAIVGGAPPDSCRFKENLNNDMAARRNALALDGYLAKDKALRLADFTPSSVEALTYRDKPYGVPHYHQYVILGWNKTLFKQVGLNPEQPPQTWTELRDYARRLTNPDSGQWGFKLYEYGPPAREQQFNWFMEWVWRAGGDVWADKARTRSTVDAPESVEAMQTMVSMIAGDRSTIPQDQPQIAVETGKLAMWMPTAVGVLNLKRTAPDLDFGLAPMPRSTQFATQLQVNSLAIMASAPERDIAWAATAFVSQEEQMQAWQADQELSAVPVRKALLDKAPWSDPASGWKPIIDVLKMPGGRPKPHIPEWDEFTEKNLCPFLLDAWTQVKTPKDALTEAARQANAWIAAHPRT